MIDFSHYADALGLVLQFKVIGAIAAGTILGIIFGALPGLTAAMGIAVLLPLTRFTSTLETRSKRWVMPRNR